MRQIKKENKIMKRATTIMQAMGIITIVMMSGCSSKAVKPQPTIKQMKIQEEANSFNDLPGWIRHPIFKNGIAEVGIARYTEGGPSFMISKAELFAEAELAKKIQNKISALSQSDRRQSDISNLDEYETNFRQVAEAYIKDVVISGAKRIHTYQSPHSGAMYVMMVIDFKTIADNLENVKHNIEKKMEEANMSRKFIEQGSKDLDKSISLMRNRAKQ